MKNAYIKSEFSQIIDIVFALIQQKAIFRWSGDTLDGLVRTEVVMALIRTNDNCIHNCPWWNIVVSVDADSGFFIRKKAGVMSLLNN